MTDSGFEPSKYLQSLVASINDAAKAAQTSAFLLLTVGLYLAATVISTSDEDLLREATRPLSQLGVAVPVVIAYALAPVVFLFLHVHTLIRYDLLAGNLRLFNAEARRLPLKADRERIRALLANVEFVQVLAAEPGAGGRSRLFRLMAWLTIAAIPVGVFLGVQISFLRYQSEAITQLHRDCLSADLGALVWFYTRLWRAKRGMAQPSRRRVAGQIVLHSLLPALLFAANLAWFDVVPRDSLTASNTNYSGFQPLDSFVCPLLGFGCRYLRLDHRTLVSAPADVLAKARKGEALLGNDLVRLEPLYLRGRSLRFADFWATALPGTDLNGADLAGAVFVGAKLQGAILTVSQLQGADLGVAQLQGADLGGAQLQGADLGGAQLQGANLFDVQLQGAVLMGIQLNGSNLQDAQLQGANFFDAKLQGTNLRDAQLQGANLWSAQLQGADLRGAHLWLVQSDETTVLGFANLRGADWAPMAAEEIDKLVKGLDSIADAERRQSVRSSIEKALKSDASAPQGPVFRLDGPVLVDDPDDPHWANVVNRGHLTTDEAAFDARLAPFLADLARSDKDVASGMVRRTIDGHRVEPQRALYPDLARRLLAIEGLKDRLSEDDRSQLETIAGAATPPPTH